MKSIWDKTSKEDIVKRLNKLNTQSKPQWGKLSCEAMLAHLADSLKMALGKLPVKMMKLPFRHWPLKQLAVYVLPIPKNTETSPELISRKSESFPKELESIEELFNEFEKQKGKNEWGTHPAFGKLSESAWGVLVYRHFDYHLTQFGV